MITENCLLDVPVKYCVAPEWRVPPQTLELNAAEVHVWRVALDQSLSISERFRNTLAPTERARAETFHFRKDRDYFIAARGALRAILGRYLNRSPRDLSFRYSSYGKPALDLGSGDDRLRFNLSHSQGMALYVIARDREVGVDIERVRSDLEVDQIAERFFSPSEISSLRALPVALRRNAFFLCWTRKEAYIKARGEGLSLPLDHFDVSIAPGEPAALLRTRPDSAEAFRWSLRDLAFESPEYAAAVAVEGNRWSLTLYQSPEL